MSVALSGGSSGGATNLSEGCDTLMINAGRGNTKDSVSEANTMLFSAPPLLGGRSCFT